MGKVIIGQRYIDKETSKTHSLKDVIGKMALFDGIGKVNVNTIGKRFFMYREVPNHEVKL